MMSLKLFHQQGSPVLVHLANKLTCEIHTGSVFFVILIILNCVLMELLLLFGIAWHDEGITSVKHTISCHVVSLVMFGIIITFSACLGGLWNTW